MPPREKEKREEGAIFIHSRKLSLEDVLPLLPEKEIDDDD